jgi:hypothetical protein
LVIYIDRHYEAALGRQSAAELVALELERRQLVDRRAA